MTSESGTGCTTFQIVGASKLVVLLLVMLRNEAPDSSAKENLVFSNDTSTMLNNVLNDAVSDTTEDDSSNQACYIIINII
jgi:hypothetical protein